MSFSSFFLLLFALFPLASTASGIPVHAHDFHSALPDTWFHPPDHPIHALFRRETQTGFDIPTTGVVFGHHPTPRVRTHRIPSSLTIACVNDFPPLPDPVVPVDPEMMPQQWKDYFSDNCEGNIPNIPQTIVSASGPTYPSGYDPTSSQVCSATYKACRMEGDIWDAPYGYMALGFDDGPWLVSG
jgi:chitin deacetylase